jgi:hypothetical protein
MTTQYNWNPVVKSFISAIKKAGFTLIEAWDGEDEKLVTDVATKASAHVCSCDDGVIVFSKEGFRFSAMIVLGNHPCETVSDWGWNKKTPKKIQDDFEKAWSAWSDTWTTRECPTIEV